jgi:peptide-methionine (S)-S-oxide reductase
MLTKSLLAIAFSAALLPAANTLPDPTLDPKPAKPGSEIAVLAGGCFWGTEAVFEHVIGVEKVLAGYAGGDAKGADYETVSSGKTNHAESIEIHFDPSKVSYGTILKIFFSVAHDPTQKNRQGPDWGRQYRSAIFYKDAAQQRIAEAYIQQLNAASVFGKPIATEVAPLKAFYAAEDYHQKFLQKHPDHPYIVANDFPKLGRLKNTYPDLWKN